MNRKKVVLTIVAGLLVLLLAAAGVALYSYWPMLSMKPVPTGAIAGTDVVSAANVSNSLYFINTADGYILIVAGVYGKLA